MPPIQLTLNITCIGIGTVGAVGAAAPTKHFKGGIAPTRFSQTYTRKQVIEVQKLVGLLPMYCIWVSFIGSEEPSIKYYVRQSSSERILAQFLIVSIRNRPSFFEQYKYNINLLLQLRLGTHYIFILFDACSMYIVEVEIKIIVNKPS